MDGGESLPLEDFIQALTSQLDRVQAVMGAKAKAGLPLTFAVKDLSMDLRAHVEMTNSTVYIRPAGPNETDASSIHLELTTITRPMMEENTREEEPDDPTLKEALDLSDEDQRRLEWAGIRKLSHLRKVGEERGEEELAQFVHLPVSRLRQALVAASQPIVSRITPERLPGHSGAEQPEGAPLLRIRGRNLMRGRRPNVSIGGHRVPVLEASERELVVAPLPDQLTGTLAVETEPGVVTERHFDAGDLGRRSGDPFAIQHEADDAERGGAPDPRASSESDAELECAPLQEDDETRGTR